MSKDLCFGPICLSGGLETLTLYEMWKIELMEEVPSVRLYCASAQLKPLPASKTVFEVINTIFMYFLLHHTKHFEKADSLVPVQHRNCRKEKIRKLRSTCYLLSMVHAQQVYWFQSFHVGSIIFWWMSLSRLRFFEQSETRNWGRPM